eukprot:gene8861-3746_t
MAARESSDYAVAAPDMMAQEEARAPSIIADEVAPDMMAEEKLVVKDSSAANSNPGSFEASSWLDVDEEEEELEEFE